MKHSDEDAISTSAGKDIQSVRRLGETETFVKFIDRCAGAVGFGCKPA